MSDNPNKRCFTRKTYTGQIYKYCVDTTITKNNTDGTGVNNGGIIKQFCDAKKGNQGFDNVTGYVYDLIIINGKKNNQAYVECDYVV